MQVTLYHNPGCGTSRRVLGMLRERGIEPAIVEYLKTPPGPEELAGLIRRMGIAPRDLLRRKEAAHAALGLDRPEVEDAAVIAAMVTNPVLIERPVVVGPAGVRLCRPAERVWEAIG
jgi:arsenate reductase (glutaredoxin)